MSKDNSSPKANPPKKTSVQLTRADFLYFTWVQAFERPVMPFLLYTFTLLIGLDIFGVWPDAQNYAIAVLLPLMGYAIWILVTSQLMWAQNPEFKKKRTFEFTQQAYRITELGSTHSVPYQALQQVLQSRQAFYLVRQEGTADIITKDALNTSNNNSKEVEQFFKGKVTFVRKSGFL